MQQPLARLAPSQTDTSLPCNHNVLTHTFTDEALHARLTALNQRLKVFRQQATLCLVAVQGSLSLRGGLHSSRAQGVGLSLGCERQSQQHTRVCSSPCRGVCACACA